MTAKATLSLEQNIIYASDRSYLVMAAGLAGWRPPRAQQLENGGIFGMDEIADTDTVPQDAEGPEAETYYSI